MASLQLSSCGLSSFTPSLNPNCIKRAHSKITISRRINLGRIKIKAVGTAPTKSGSETSTPPVEPPSVRFAFIHSVLLPDGTPDVHFRTACGGQKLRNIMLDSNVELYGPYARPLLNCGGGGTCATCIVEIVEGKELLSPRTDKEREKLKKHPKNYRLACQTTVGTPDSTGVLVVQQLPEWKAHEWTYERIPAEEYERELQQFKAELESKST